MTIDAKTAKAALDWILEKGTVWTGVCAAAGFATLIVITLAEPKLAASGYKHEAVDDIRSNAFYFWAVLGVTAIIHELRKNRRLNVAIAADNRLADPSVPNESTVPEVQAKMDKIVRHSRETGASLIETRPQKPLP